LQIKKLVVFLLQIPIYLFVHQKQNHAQATNKFITDSRDTTQYKAS